MSWSVSAVGRVPAVKAALARAFASAKLSTHGVAHEQRSVVMAEALVNNELDALESAELVKAVSVEACGSASSAGGKLQASQVRMEVKPIYGFVE